jgi:hypothetical protein
MGTGPAAGRPQSGAISTALVGLAGFAAGALVVGLLALARHPASATNEPMQSPESNLAAHEVVPAPAIVTRDKEWPPPAEPFPWPFESQTHASIGAPGKNRPDRLSGPEGWTHDAAGSNEPIPRR